jgi:phytoene desaturase
MDDRRLARLEPSSSAFILYLGVRRTFPGVAHHSIFFGPDFARDLREIFTERRPLSEPSFYVCAPSATDRALAPPGATSLYVLAPAPALAPGVDWDALAPAYADRLIDRVEAAGFPGLRDSIAVRRCYTPADFARDYHCHRGSIFGLSARFDQTAFRRPAPRSRDVAGLYLVGGSTQPGGGVPMVLLGGKLVARAIRDDAARGAL